MSTDTDAFAHSSRTRDDPRSAAVTTDLRAVFVEYADGPDRCTIHPTGVSGVERMSTWLTADADDVVDLRDAR